MDFYHKLGKVRSVNALADPDTVFRMTNEALFPNIVCFAGATCTGKTTLAHHFKDHANYGYIDFSKFCRKRGLRSCEQKAKALMQFLDRIPSRGFVLDGFPQTAKQAKILFETFGHPLRLFFLEAEKDEVHNRIHKHTQQNKAISATELKEEYDEYLKHKDELFNFIKNKPFFTALDTKEPIIETFKLVKNHLSPTVHFVNRNENKQLFNEYSKALEKKGFLYINLTKLQEADASRGIHRKETSGESQWDEKGYGKLYALLRRVLYAEPTQNKKFLISNYPNDVNFLRGFSEHVCDFKLLLHFTKNEGGEPTAQLENFPEEHLQTVGYYHGLNRLVPVGVNDPTIVDFFSEKRNRYGVLAGPTSTGKTTIAKDLKKNNVCKVVLFDKFKEEVIKRLTKDDVAPEDVPFAAILTELNKDMAAAHADQFFVLDGFLTVDGNFAQLVKGLGDPLFILRLEVTKDLLIKKFQAKKEGAELTEEDNDIINKSFASFTEVNNKIAEMVNLNSNLRVYDIGVTGPVATTLSAVRSIFRKRIMLTRIVSQELNQKELKLAVAWLCAKFDYQFVDMDLVLQEAKRSNPYGTRDPKQVMEIIKRIVDSDKRMGRNVMLYNYVQADLGARDKTFYPNSKDEIFFLEQHLGTIRGCLNFVDQPEVLEVEEKLVPKVEKPVVQKKKNDDGTDADPDDANPDDPEEKKKFKPENFDWFEVPDTPKTFPQFFGAMHALEKVEVL